MGLIELAEITLKDLTDEEIATIMLNGITPSKEFIGNLKKALPYVALYSEKNSVPFLVHGSTEGGKFRPAFLFLGEDKAKTYDDLMVEFG